MSKKNLLPLFILIAAASIFNLKATAQETESAARSNLTAASLPANAARINKESVPAEVNQALAKLIAAGGDGIRQGESEVLAWTGNYKKSNATNIIRQLTANLQAAGWKYEVGGENEGVTVFSLMRTAPQKRGILGFYTFSDDALVVAWTEMLAAKAGGQQVSASVQRESNDLNPRGDNSSAKVVEVGKNDGYVNLMGGEMPAPPTFPALKAKPGFVRGYVRDWTGKPLAGATLGVRASYFAGHYSGAQGVTDANGFYEFAVPKGSAHFYNAGYQMDWGEGLAAVGLHPADGRLGSFTTAGGAVENFVLLPYGITSRANAQDNPQNSGSYYGGSIYVFYGAFEASDNRPYAGYVPENSIIEISLTSGNGQSFLIRKVAGFQSYFRINNIPLARYQISAKVNGKSLNLTQTGSFNEMFGMKPRETNGAATILLEPDGAKSESVAPQSGWWKPISINLALK